MSAGGSEDTAGTGDPAAEEESTSHAGSSGAAVELPRKRKGDVETRSNIRETFDSQMDDELSRSEEEDQQVKMKCFREPHCQIEKRRRDKMNNLIDELSAMIPACQPMARKLDKLTVLRKAVQHLKALKAGTSSAFIDTPYKPSILPHDDLRHILLRAVEGFLLVVTCDTAKILFISESVSKVLNFSRLELTGQSLFDFIHPKDINKVKEQLSLTELSPRQRFIDGASTSVAMSVAVQPQSDVPVKASHLSTGARRSFFCRMKHSRVAGKQDEKQSLPSVSKRKGHLLRRCKKPKQTDPSNPLSVDTYRYCTLHCTGYMRSWLSSQLDSEGDAEKEPSNLTCLVMVCRIHPTASHQPSKDITVKPTEFTTRCSIDGKFTFVDQQATTIIGYLPQEVLGTSCYEYFHQNDLLHLAEKHRQVLQSKEKIETQCYKFKTKYGYYVSLQSQWFSFTNPWTKEIEFIVSLNRLISEPGHTKDEGEAGSSKALQEDTKQIPIIPGISSGVGTMIYAGSIGTQIANELIDSYRVNSSPSSGASSPFGLPQEKGPVVSPQTSRSASSREEAAGSSQSQSESSTVAGAGGASTERTGEPSQLDMDNVVPGLSSFSNDEAAMAVLMSLLETDVTMSQVATLEDLQWSHTDF